MTRGNHKDKTRVYVRLVSESASMLTGEEVERWSMDRRSFNRKKLCVGNSSVVKIYVIRPKQGPFAKNATPRPSGWESNPRPLDY